MKQKKNYVSASSQIKKQILSWFCLAKFPFGKMTNASLASLYTVKQVSSAVQLSERAVRQAISDGRLDVIRIGKSVRISKAAIAAWLCLPIDQVSSVLPSLSAGQEGAQ